jgi:arylsulfatase A-like enzyme
MTFPAHSSILTGEYPFSHGVRNNTNYSLGLDNKTIAEVLHDAGWRTAAFVGATILEGKLGLNQGFDEYHDDMYSGVQRTPTAAPWASRKAENVNYDFINWLNSLPREKEGESKGWFAWVHYYDPHFPYDPPERWASRFANDPYLGEIGYMDEAFGKIVDELKSRNMYDNTLIVAVGDHGEGRGEHGELCHALWAYNSTLRVPLIISDPDSGRAAKVISGPASSVDIFPTILKWCGVAAQENPGFDLLNPDVQISLQSRAVYFESMEARISWNWAGLRGIIQNKRKYIYSPLPEFYDLNADPKETNNLYASNPDISREMKTSMYQLVDQWRRESESPERTLTPEEIAKLRSLGYVTGGNAPTSSEELERIEGLPDLKTKADVVDKASRLKEEADAAFESGDYRKAKDRYAELLQLAEVVSALQNLGEIALWENDESQSIKYMQRVTQLAPWAVKSWYNLGVAQHTFGHDDEAQGAFTKAMQINPADPINVDSLVGLALCASDRRDWQGALDHIAAARGMDPNRRDLVGYEASIHYQLGKTAIADSEMKKSYDLYVIFLSTGTGSVSNYYEAGQAAIRVHDLQKALEWTTRARDLTPADDPNRAGLDQLVSQIQQTAGNQPGNR